MGSYVVIGAGGVGRHAAQALSEWGHEVRVVSRQGTDPQIRGVSPHAADAADPAALARVARGASAIINAANPRSYHTWQRDWPPLAASLLATAEATGAGLVTVSNLYAYGRVSAPMTEETPIAPAGTKGEVRARMWADALAAHEAGRIRATELRASDYFGPGVGARVSLLNEAVIARAATGRAVRFPLGDLDAPHSWSFVPDVGRFAALLATDERSWGRPWHVPTARPRSIRHVAADVADLVGRPAPAVSTYPRWLMSLARVAPMVRELDETRHQFERPFVLDSSAATAGFGVQPTPWRAALATTISAVTSGQVLEPQHALLGDGGDERAVGGEHPTEGEPPAALRGR
ncbi:MAG: NAD-dependent epimerase/dehydratase family protein [Dermatophilaceae bacterium]